jgi:hypothetical protein
MTPELSLILAYLSVRVNFCHYDKIQEMINLQRKKVYLVHRFRGSERALDTGLVNSILSLCHINHFS